VDRAGAISMTRVCLRSAELFYEPSGQAPLGKATGPVSSIRAAVIGRALRYVEGFAPARRPSSSALTFLLSRALVRSIPLSLDPVAGVFLLSGVGAWPPPDGVG
jgi:hypothetical protein